MTATIMATTASGAIYVMSIDFDGVRWFRVPPRGSLADAATGWQTTLPRVVPGERLLLGALQSTRIVDVAFIPGPIAGSAGVILNDASAEPAHRGPRSGPGDLPRWFAGPGH